MWALFKACGIPDFRSENGLYSQLEDYEGLDDPHDMFGKWT
jgi:NAD-dependent SIR2 family protein deacetylase